MDAQGQELDFGEKAIVKTIDIKLKALLYPLSGTREIDSRYAQENWPAKKEEKNSKKIKSINTPSTNVFSSKYQSSAHQSQTSKKDRDYQRVLLRQKGQRDCSYDSLITGANTNIIKKKKGHLPSQVLYLL